MLGKIPPSGKVVWRKPEACHKARFCSFGIYSLKALAFSKQLDLDDDTVDSVAEFCRFLTFIYIPFFLSSSVRCDSSINDLQLYKSLFANRIVNQVLADEALVVLRRHGWYLTPDVVLFSLFSNKLSSNEKSRISSRLLTYQSMAPDSYKLEKPKGPFIEETTELVDLVSPLSFKFFKVLNTDLAWLSMDPEEGDGDDNYRNTK